ncbi:hypothetical protein VTK26DRAFT_3829 [Humicola hyalothermophila]
MFCDVGLGPRVSPSLLLHEAPVRSQDEQMQIPGPSGRDRNYSTLKDDSRANFVMHLCFVCTDSTSLSANIVARHTKSDGQKHLVSCLGSLHITGMY